MGFWASKTIRPQLLLGDTTRSDHLLISFIAFWMNQQNVLNLCLFILEFSKNSAEDKVQQEYGITYKYKYLHHVKYKITTKTYFSHLQCISHIFKAGYLFLAQIYLEQEEDEREKRKKENKNKDNLFLPPSPPIQFKSPDIFLKAHPLKRTGF